MLTGGTPSFGDISSDREEQAGEEDSEATSNQPSNPKLSASDTRTDSNANRRGAEGRKLERRKC
jgi:hypothetical protein